MPKSPNQSLDGVLNVKVFVDGKDVGNNYNLLSFKIRKELNRISKALLIFEAGDMPEGLIPESDLNVFLIGKSVVVKAGYAKELTIVFSGIVAYHNPEITSQNNTSLHIECRDYAFNATQLPKSRIFNDKTDKQILSTVLKDYQLNLTIKDADTKHTELVQHDCVDWDFVLSRAKANGLIVVSDGKSLTIKKPDVSTEQEVKVTYGDDIIEFSGKLNTTNQFSKVVVQSWKYGEQKMIEATSVIPNLNKQGSKEEEAKSDPYIIKTSASVGLDALQKMANAQALIMGLSRIQGACKFCGNASLEIGKVIGLSGCGKRFDGKVYVGALEHDFNEDGWTTTIFMGLQDSAEKSLSTSHSAASSKSSAVSSSPSTSTSLFSPSIEGLHIGKVKKIDADPENQFRIQVEMAMYKEGNMTIWARLANFWSSNGYGAFFIPDIDDEVILGFIDNNPAYPVIMGSMYSSKRAPSYEIEKSNKIRAITTKSKMVIEFQEEDKVITIQTPGKNIIKISDKDKGIELTDQNKNKIVMNDSGIVIESSKGLTLKAKNDITIDAGMNVKMKAKSNIEQKGMNVELKADAALTLKGTAKAELSASGQTVVKGAMVMIN